MDGSHSSSVTGSYLSKDLLLPLQPHHQQQHYQQHHQQQQQQHQHQHQQHQHQYHQQQQHHLLLQSRTGNTSLLRTSRSPSGSRSTEQTS